MSDCQECEGTQYVPCSCPDGCRRCDGTGWRPCPECVVQAGLEAMLDRELKRERGG